MMMTSVATVYQLKDYDALNTVNDVLHKFFILYIYIYCVKYVNHSSVNYFFVNWFMIYKHSSGLGPEYLGFMTNDSCCCCVCIFRDLSLLSLQTRPFMNCFTRHIVNNMMTKLDIPLTMYKINSQSTSSEKHTKIK